MRPGAKGKARRVRRGGPGRGAGTIGPVADDIQVTVRLFGALREAAGTGRLELRVLPATPAGALWGQLPDAVRRLGLPDGARYAVNHQWTLPGATLRDGDEVALVLPVSGG
jgi:molybdopterin converting factor small subunit